jgi:hypothetical protein
MTIVMDRFARLREHSPWVVCRFVSELRIADVVSLGEVGSEAFEWLRDCIDFGWARNKMSILGDGTS